MKSFNEWTSIQKFYQMGENILSNDASNSVRPNSVPLNTTNNQPTSMPTPHQNAAIEEPKQDLNNDQQMKGTIGSYLQTFGKKIQNQNPNIILQIQSQFNQMINQILKDKSTSYGKRGAKNLISFGRGNL
jgi:hypothetical protein